MCALSLSLTEVMDFVCAVISHITENTRMIHICVYKIYQCVKHIIMLVVNVQKGKFYGVKLIFAYYKRNIIEP